MRLDKLLSAVTGKSRSDVKKTCKSGKVSVNGKMVQDPGFQVDPEKDEVFLEGQAALYEKYHYFLMDKPPGVVTAREDGRFPTVMDVFRDAMPDASEKGLSPVGRLDKDTTGLLLITDDGELAHRLLSPARHVDKTYEVLCDGILTREDVDAFSAGMDIGEKKPLKPAKLEIKETGLPYPEGFEPDALGNHGGKSPRSFDPDVLKDAGKNPAEGSAEDALKVRGKNMPEPGKPCSLAYITISEGKYHQVKRMFAKTGKPVLLLRRLSFGPLHLDEGTEIGAVRALIKDEVAALKSAAGLEEEA